MKFKMCRDKKTHSFDEQFVKHDVELFVDGRFNTIELYCNDHCKTYKAVKVKGRNEFMLKLISQERCYR